MQSLPTERETSITATPPHSPSILCTASLATPPPQSSKTQQKKPFTNVHGNTRIQQKLVAGPTLGPAHQKQLPKPACSTDHLGKLKLSCCSSHSGIDGTAAQRQLCSMHCSTTAQHNRQKGTTRRLQWKIWGGSHHPKTPQPRPALLTHHSAKRDAGATATQDSVQATRHAASQAHAPACVTSAASGQATSCA